MDLDVSEIGDGDAVDVVDGAMFTRINTTTTIQSEDFAKCYDDDTPPLLVGYKPHSVFYHDPQTTIEPSAEPDDSADIDLTADDSDELLDQTEHSVITRTSGTVLGAEPTATADQLSLARSDLYDQHSDCIDRGNDEAASTEYLQLTPYQNKHGKNGVTQINGARYTHEHSERPSNKEKDAMCCSCCDTVCCRCWNSTCHTCCNLTFCVSARQLFRFISPLVFPVISIVLFIADIGSDIYLAWTYRRDDETDFFYVTVACILVPSAIMAVVDLSWVWLDRKSSADDRMYLLWRIPVGVLSFGKVVRTISHIRHMVKRQSGPQADWHKQRAIEERRDFTMLDFINAFAESAPQLFVQLFILYKFDPHLTAPRGLSLLSSWISIAWTYATYYRCHREALSGKNDVNNVGFAFFFLSVLSALATRVVCIVLFLVHYKLLIGFCVIAGHYVFMLVWIICQKPKLEGTASAIWSRMLYCLFFAYVSMLYFVNLRNGRARIRMIVFYGIFYVENSVMAGLLLWKLVNNSTYIDACYSLLALPVGCAMHVVLLILYYRFFHPTMGIFYTSSFAVSKTVSKDMLEQSTHV